MLYHEFLRDDVTVRAQALSFLMVFSLLPLIAGAFFLFTFFAQFGMVQDAITGGLDNVLSSIPPVHRQYINESVLRFKDAYLAGITETSRSVGIFALFILAWVGLQVFTTLDTTLNHIWFAERARPLLEKIRSFIVVTVLAPIVITGGFSVPLILQRLPVTRYFFERFPLLNVLLNYVVPLLLVMAIFLMMYRFLPVRRVWWRSAFWGALFSTVGLALINVFMRVYFAVGMNSAYGKAAVVPLIGFWIYLLWIVIILGAELSYLYQNGQSLFVDSQRSPTLHEGRGILACLVVLYRAHQNGSGPVPIETLREQAELTSGQAAEVLGFLTRAKLAVECLGQPQAPGCEYVLAREVDSLNVKKLLLEFFAPSDESSLPALDKTWRKSLAHWSEYFESVKLSELSR